MTVTTVVTSNQYAGNGVTDTFDYDFAVYEEDELVVRDIDESGAAITLVLNSDYTVTGAGTAFGGTITLDTPTPIDHTLDIRPVYDLLQPTNIRNQTRFLAEVHEAVFDRVTRYMQYLKRQTDRAIKIADYGPITGTDLGDADQRGGKYLYFNETTGAPELATAIDSVPLTKAIIGETFYPRTQDEIDEGITPADYSFASNGDFRRYTTIHDGSADITSVLTAINAIHPVITFPPGTIINCINWVPLANTIIIAHGAAIRRHSDAVYSTTTSSDAVVIANANIEVRGGKWTQGSGATQATWSGSFLIDGGDNFRISDAEITGTWGGIHGNEEQNGSNIAEGVSVTNCWFHDCQHNNYFADIDGLVFSNNVSEDSDRDGVRTYRNCQNITITGNILRNNGDGTVGQSQDGIDLFVAGYRVVITGNIIYGNTVKGVDIKRNADFPSEPVENHEIIVADNIIFDNDNVGVSVDVADAVGFVDYIKIHGNIVAENASRGIYCLFLRYGSIVNNTVYGNGGDGIRNDSSEQTVIAGNVVVNNTGVGISIVSSSAHVSQNRLTSTGVQTTGISLSSGTCRNNSMSGHTTNFSLSGTLPVRGKIISVPFARVTTTQLLTIAEMSAISGIEMSTNIAEAAMDVTFSKRNATTGAFSANICNNAAVAFATAFVAVSQTVTGTNGQRNVAGGEMLTLTLANITTNTWTAGMAKIHYVD